MAVGLGVFHTERRISGGARVADALSKGNMEEVRREITMGGISVTRPAGCCNVQQWLLKPRLHMALRRLQGGVRM